MHPAPIMDLKRKRGLHDEETCTNSNKCHSKRRSLTRLPLRTPPAVCHDRLWSSWAHIYQQPLTPVDSSDDEVSGQADRISSHQQASPRKSQQVPADIIPSVTIDVSDDAYMNGIDTEGPNTAAAGEPFASSFKSMNLLSAPTSFLSERIPTPMAATFNIGSIQRSRSRRPNSITTLDPVMVEESCLPSPIETHDALCHTDQEMSLQVQYHNSESGFTLSVCKDEEMMENTGRSESLYLDLDGKEVNGHVGRNARLHMGFRADCEKCQHKVPGHYSHIIWS